ncbi:MAG: hypothetical protein GY847_07170 [Proteobacteria bacterium]|nr:hypothetical protein [Pseudomonadota bacterium]
MSKTGRSLGEGGPIEIRYRLAYDGKLLSDVLAVFLRVVRGWYYRKAKEAGKTGETSDDEDAAPRKYRLSWSALLVRIFQIDMKCPHCGSKMKVVAAVTDPTSIRHYLEGTGQSAELPTLAPARAPPQEEWDF